MAHPSQILPSKCCCCSLRAGSIVVGSFTLIVALTFLGLTATASSALSNSCSYNYDTSRCEQPSEALKMVANMMALLAVLNAVEAIMSVCLIWGASKLILSMVRGWLIVSASWILLHSAVAIAYAFASTYVVWPILISVIGIFIFGMALLCMLTVMSFHQEICNSLPYSNIPAPGASRSAEEPLPPYYETHPKAEI
ncbi:Protein of unknown function [Gryllus bimaculatus]|nr:Protein of unknown function [Gryllus bimaculatus]